MTAKSIKHKFVSGIADGSDATQVRPSNWNDDHNIFWGVRPVTTTTDTIADGDHMCVIQYNNASAIAVTLPQAGASSLFISGWVAWLQNKGSGLVTITPTTSTVNGASSFTLETGAGAVVFSDGTNYIALISRGPGNATPLMNGTAATGTALKWSHEDHVHPVDTSRAPLASPTFTGTPTAPTPSAGDSTTNIATTAFVQGELSSGAWTTYTPVVTAQTGSITTYTATGRYKKIGKVVLVQMIINISSVGTGSGFVRATLPVAPTQDAVGSGFDSVTSGKQQMVWIESANNRASIRQYDAVSSIQLNANIICSAAYEA